MAQSLATLHSLITTAQPHITYNSATKSWTFNPPAAASSDNATIQAAIAKSNQAARITPQAVALSDDGPGTTSSKSSDDIKSVVGTYIDDLLVVGKIGDDIVGLQKYGSSKLHWWGWEAQITEDGMVPLLDLLGAETAKLGLIIAALASSIPVLAAIGGAIAIVGPILATDIKNGDTNNHGVNLTGYLWLGLSVKPLP